MKIKKFNNKKKKGLSAIVTTLLMVALAIVLVGIIWAAVTNLVRTQMKSSSCVNIVGQVSLNNEYTCYNSTSHELRFAISRGDTDIGGILVGVYSQGTGKTFEMTNKSAPVAFLLRYPSMDPNITIPNKNSEFVYTFDMSAAGFTDAPSQITISPIVGTTQCSTSDQLNSIDDCNLLA